MEAGTSTALGARLPTLCCDHLVVPLPRRTAGKQANELNETWIGIAADAWCKHRVWSARLDAYRPVLSRKLLHHNTGGRRRHAFRVHHQCPGCHRQLGIEECFWAWLVALGANLRGGASPVAKDRRAKTCAVRIQRPRASALSGWKSC